MKRFQLLLFIALAICTQTVQAQSQAKVYEITISTTDADGKEDIKELIIEGKNMDQAELDALIQEQLLGNGANVDVNVNVNISEPGIENNGISKTITKVIKQRNNSSDEEKIIIDDTNMQVEVKENKIYINGEEIKEGDFGDRKVRILTFEEGDEIEIENILKEEDIEIGKGEKVYLIEREMSSEGIAFLGVSVGQGVQEGVVVRRVVEGTSAEKMGLKVNDVLLTIDGKKVTSFNSISKIIKAYLPGELVKVSYLSNEELKETNIALSDYGVYQDNQNAIREERNKNRTHNRKNHKRNNLYGIAPRLGVMLSKESQVKVIIGRVFPESAAEKAGLQAGDIILKIDKATVLGQDQFIATINTYKVGDEVKLKILRDGKKRKVKALLQKRNTRKRGLKNNKANRIERIIIKEQKEGDSRTDLESGGAIRLRDFDLSPNPSYGKVNVSFEMNPLQSGDILTVRIISIDGRIIKEQLLEKFDGRFDASYDLTEIASGIYLFQVEKNKQKFTKRFVLKQK